MSLSFDYMCMRLPFILWFIEGVPSSQALLGFLITVSESVCVSDLIGALACGFQTQKNKKGCLLEIKVGLGISRKTRILGGIQFTTHFIEFLVVETKRFVGSTVNVILTRKPCGQHSSSLAGFQKANNER